MTSDKKFACAINCMDGRVQDAVKNYMKNNYGVDYVDMITEPGPNKILCEENDCDMAVINDIKKRIEISVHHHGSKQLAVVGHFGCAGNPAPKEEQVEQLKKCKKVIDSFGFSVEVVMLWVDGDWETVEKIG
jgi:carbonic anhydrase